MHQKSIQHGLAAENLFAEMMSTTSLAEMALENGQLQLAFEIASQAVDRIERSGVLHPISAVVYASLGDAFFQWYQIEGDLEAAVREIQKAMDLLPLEVPAYMRQGVVSQRVRIFLALNRPAAAEIALQGEGFSFRDQFSFPELTPGQSISHSVDLLYNSSLRLLLYQARAGNDPTKLVSGVELADRMIARALHGRQLLIALEALLLRAQMHALMGNHPASHELKRMERKNRVDL